jgi:hypothetical protein
VKQDVTSRTDSALPHPLGCPTLVCFGRLIIKLQFIGRRIRRAGEKKVLAGGVCPSRKIRHPVVDEIDAAEMGVAGGGQAGSLLRPGEKSPQSGAVRALRKDDGAVEAYAAIADRAVEVARNLDRAPRESFDGSEARHGLQ